MDWPNLGVPPAPQTAPDSLDNSAGLTIKFNKGDEVKVGQLLSYVAMTQRPGYLTKFDATPDGSLIQIYPNAQSLRSPTGGIQSSRLNPGQLMIVLDYRDTMVGFFVRVLPPRGEGLIVAILSEQPL